MASTQHDCGHLNNIQSQNAHEITQITVNHKTSNIMYDSNETQITIKKYLQARIFKYLFLFLFSSANDSEFDSEDGGVIRFISCQSATMHTNMSLTSG